jgi:hypothetical protein
LGTPRAANMSVHSFNTRPLCAFTQDHRIRACRFEASIKACHNVSFATGVPFPVLQPRFSQLAIYYVMHFLKYAESVEIYTFIPSGRTGNASISARSSIALFVA